MSLIDFNKFNLELIDEYGKKLYQTNENYKQIVNVMEHLEFKDFFNKHFNNLENAKAILMFMKLYQTIENSYSTELNPYQKIAILDGMIKDKDTRQHIVQKFLEIINPLECQCKDECQCSRNTETLNRVKTMPNLTYKQN